MSIVNLFSKRQRKLRGEVPDVYVYNTIPERLKVQIIHIWHDTLGQDERRNENTRAAYRGIVEMLRHEYGIFRLSRPTDLVVHQQESYYTELANFILGEDNYEKVLDAIELSFQLIDVAVRDPQFHHRYDASDLADNAIEELNSRFQEHGVGYRFEEGQIVRVDSDLLHTEAVKPALALLRAPEYAGAQAEFLKAHEQYRHGRSKEALADCLKSLESVMKSICAKRKWTHDPKATSSVLIQMLFDKGLVPQFWSQHFSALRATLESGVPTARNRLAGHGQGRDVVEVPTYLVGYVLHQTAAAIVFLVEAEKVLRGYSL